MQCELVREMLSAQLDGEDLPGEAERTEAHLAQCAHCRHWFDAAALVTRRARTTVAAIEPTQDKIFDVVRLAAPGPGWARVGRLLRVLLGLMGFAQFMLGVVQIASLGLRAGVGSADGMSSHHLLHESAAWNVAIGAGFLWIAWRRERPAGILPILSVFVGVLVLLSVSDLLSGEVAVASLATHTFVALGYVILLILRHPGFDAVPPTRRGWRLRLCADQFDEPIVRRPVDGAGFTGITARAGGSPAEDGRRRHDVAA